MKSWRAFILALLIFYETFDSVFAAGSDDGEIGESYRRSIRRQRLSERHQPDEFYEEPPEYTKEASTWDILQDLSAEEGDANAAVDFVHGYRYTNAGDAVLQDLSPEEEEIDDGTPKGVQEGIDDETPEIVRDLSAEEVAFINGDSNAGGSVLQDLSPEEVAFINGDSNAGGSDAVLQETRESYRRSTIKQEPNRRSIRRQRLSERHQPDEFYEEPRNWGRNKAEEKLGETRESYRHSTRRHEPNRRSRRRPEYTKEASTWDNLSAEEVAFINGDSNAAGSGDSNAGGSGDSNAGGSGNAKKSLLTRKGCKLQKAMKQYGDSNAGVPTHQKKLERAVAEYDAALQEVLRNGTPKGERKDKSKSRSKPRSRSPSLKLLHEIPTALHKENVSNVKKQIEAYENKILAGLLKGTERLKKLTKALKVNKDEKQSTMKV